MTHDFLGKSTQLYKMSILLCNVCFHSAKNKCLPLNVSVCAINYINIQNMIKYILSFEQIKLLAMSVL